MNEKYTETKIADIKDKTLLWAIKDVAYYAFEIKKSISVGDDGEWDYKLNKAITHFREEFENLASINIEIGENDNRYYGELSLERFIQEFTDFYELLGNISPLGEEESRFFIAFSYLQNRIDTRKRILHQCQPSPKYLWDDIHESIKKVSESKYQSKHYADAVESAFKEVIKRVKDYVNPIIMVNPKLDGDRLMNRAFGFENQEPIIKFNDLITDEHKDEQRGIMNLFKGIVGIRNRKAHENIILEDPLRALEYLATASLLMRLLDNNTE
jgi:uncharacterized protein (TIGR02391 family)